MTTTITLLDDMTSEGLRVAHTVVAEACQSHAELRGRTFVLRGRDFRCRVGEQAEVVIRFRAAGSDTRIVVEVIDPGSTRFGRVRRRSTSAVALAFVDAVGQAIGQLGSAARCVDIEAAA